MNGFNEFMKTNKRFLHSEESSHGRCSPIRRIPIEIPLNRVLSLSALLKLFRKLFPLTIADSVNSINLTRLTILELIHKSFMKNDLKACLESNLQPNSCR